MRAFQDSGFLCTPGKFPIPLETWPPFLCGRSINYTQTPKVLKKKNRRIYDDFRNLKGDCTGVQQRRERRVGRL